MALSAPASHPVTGTMVPCGLPLLTGRELLFTASQDTQLSGRWAPFLSMSLPPPPSPCYFYFGHISLPFPPPLTWPATQLSTAQFDAPWLTIWPFDMCLPHIILNSPCSMNHANDVFLKFILFVSSSQVFSMQMLLFTLLSKIYVFPKQHWSCFSNFNLSTPVHPQVCALLFAVWLYPLWKQDGYTPGCNGICSSCGCVINVLKY